MSLKRQLLTSSHSLALASALVCFISRIRFTSHNRRNNHKEVQQRGGGGGGRGGEGRGKREGGREARYGSRLQAHSWGSSLRFSPAVGRAMVFVRKCASDCRLKYGLSPDPISARTPATATTVRARPPANRTDGQNRAWGFVWRNARFIMRPSKQVGRSSPPRPAPPSAASLCTTGGGIISIENNRQTGGRTEREATCRSTDTQTQGAYASVHRRHPSSGQHE